MRIPMVAALLLVAGGCGKPPVAVSAAGKPLTYWVEAVKDPQVKVRREAVKVLGNVGSTHAASVAALAGALKDADSEVRAGAALGLLKIGPAAREARAALVEAQQDADPRVRQYAAQALARIGG